jgi:adenosine kinase
MPAASTFKFFSIGNPLLDIQVRDGEKLLSKYNLKADDAILAGDEQSAM